jgi:hypothetical protein
MNEELYILSSAGRLSGHASRLTDQVLDEIPPQPENHVDRRSKPVLAMVTAMAGAMTLAMAACQAGEGFSHLAVVLYAY